jgi:hypothetical protein
MTSKRARSKGARTLARARAAGLVSRQRVRWAPGLMGYRPWDIMNPDVYRIG